MKRKIDPYTDFQNHIFDQMGEQLLIERQVSRKELVEVINSTGAADEFFGLAKSGKTGKELFAWIDAKRREKGLTWG